MSTMDQGKVVRQVADVQKLIVSIEDSKLFHEAISAALLLTASLVEVVSFLLELHGHI